MLNLLIPLGNNSSWHSDTYFGYYNIRHFYIKKYIPYCHTPYGLYIQLHDYNME